MLHFAVFGSHPRLSLAEFRSIRPDLAQPDFFGAVAMFEAAAWDGAALMARLGGTVKLGDVRGEARFDGELAGKIADLILKDRGLPSVDFGLTVYAAGGTGKTRFARLGMELKKKFKKRGLASRWVTGKQDANISPAAVAKLKLAERGFDVCLLIRGERAFIGFTTHVQDADAWSRRDYGRPARDEVAGMLPPKLARIMVNLARLTKADTILDPFCGSGTILMEAALATDAKRIIGSDIEARQIQASRRNTDWLISERILDPNDGKRMDFIQTDIRRIDARLKPATVDRVVTEGHLGPPLKGHETARDLKRIADEISGLWREALLHLHPILRTDSRMVCVWPSFKTTHGTARVDLSGDPTLAGRYLLIDPLAGWEASGNPLLYHRPGQYVMRRIVVLDKIGQ